MRCRLRGRRRQGNHQPLPGGCGFDVGVQTAPEVRSLSHHREEEANRYGAFSNYRADRTFSQAYLITAMF
jgi:hypothetical protein